jgi:hypothetical protein
MSDTVYLRQKSGSQPGWRFRRNIEYVAGGFLGFGTDKKIAALTPFNNATISGAIITGAGAAPVAGGAGSSVELANQKTAVADNTNAAFFRVTVPNAIEGGAIELTSTGTQGDGDSTASSWVLVSFSRIAGAATVFLASAASPSVATVGGTSTAVLTVSVGNLTGANSAVQTFDVNIKLARSAGASTNHTITSQANLINALASGATIAAL